MALEKIRKAAGNDTITVTSGFRCARHNQAVGGKENSYHLQGRAVDFRHRTLRPLQLYKLIHRMWPEQFGIGLYEQSEFIHFDSGPCRRWREG